MVDNAHVRSLAGVATVFTTSSWAGAGDASVPMYRPLTTLSYSLNYALGGLAPLGFHLANVLLHAVVCVLVLLLALHVGLGLPAAVVAAALFAVMPVHVEAVANVAGRKDLLVAAFSIGALLAHSRAMRRGGFAIALAPLLVAGALLSKEAGLVLVGLLAAHDLFFARAEWRAHRRRALGLFASYVAVTLLFVLARHAVLDTLVFPRIPFDENPVADAPAWVRMMTAVAVLGRGLVLLVLPASLSADYSYAAILPVTSPLDPAFLASAAAIVALAAIAWRFRKPFPLGPFAFLWYGISIFPASNLAVPIGTIFGERLLYVPSVAFALVVGAGAGRLLASRARVAAMAAVAVVLGLYGLRTWDYSRAWANDLTVFTAAATAQPDSAKAQRMLGGALMEAGRPGEAIAAFRRAEAIVRRPGTPQDRLAPALVEQGVALEKLGLTADARRLYEEVLRTDPAPLRRPLAAGRRRVDAGGSSRRRVVLAADRDGGSRPRAGVERPRNRGDGGRRPRRRPGGVDPRDERLARPRERMVPARTRPRAAWRRGGGPPGLDPVPRHRPRPLPGDAGGDRAEAGNLVSAPLNRAWRPSRNRPAPASRRSGRSSTPPPPWPCGRPPGCAPRRARAGSARRSPGRRGRRRTSR